MRERNHDQQSRKYQHDKGHVMYFICGLEEYILVTSDACNTLRQFETGLGPGHFSSDLDDGQEIIDQIKAFKESYPE
jgi:hypothetical protein